MEKLVWFFIACAISVGMALLLFVPTHRSISVQAITEVVDVEVNDERGTESYACAIGLRDNTEELRFIKKEEVALHFAKGARLHVVRTATGPVYIDVRSVNERSVGSVQEGTGRKTELGSSAFIRFGDKAELCRGAQPAADEGLVIPVRGHFWIGDDVGNRTTTTLLSASVQILETAVITGERYVAARLELLAGDRLVYPSANEDTSGFVRLGIERALLVYFQTNALKLQIQQYGSASYAITSTLWQRLSNDPVLVPALAFLAGSIAFFAALLQVLGIAYDWFHSKNENADIDIGKNRDVLRLADICKRFKSSKGRSSLRSLARRKRKRARASLPTQQ